MSSKEIISSAPKPGYLSQFWSKAGSAASTVKNAAYQAVAIPASLASSALTTSKDALNAVRHDPKEAAATLGRKSIVLWNQIPGYAKTAAAAAVLWTAPELLLWGAWKVPAAGYLGWRHVPNEAKEGIKQLPPVAKVTNLIEPVMEQFKTNLITSAVQTQIVAAGNDINPLHSPPEDVKPVLTKIKDTATKVLDEAAKQGVVLNEIGDRLPLQIIPDEPPSPLSPPSPVSNVGQEQIRSVPPATGPRKASDPVDMKAETDRQLDKLSMKLSVFSVLQYMISNICKIEEADNCNLFQLVSAASEPSQDGSYPSVWKLFTAKYPMTFSQKFRAACFYFFFYKLTALIPNAVDTYVKRFVNVIRAQLTDKNSNENSDKHIQRIIDNSNGFLKAYNDAADDFIAGKIPAFSTLAEYRTNRISMQYGGSIWQALEHNGPALETTLHHLAKEESLLDGHGVRPDNALLVKPYMKRAREILCKKVSRVLVDTYSPQIEFFRNWRKHSFGRKFTPLFNLVEGVLNGIVRWGMKKYILPPVLSSVAEKSMDATSKGNISFSIAMIKFATEQIQKLQQAMAASDADAKPSLYPPPAVDHLGELVKKLLLTLDQVPLETKEDFEKYRQQKKSDFDQNLQKDIEKTITESCKVLFQFVAQPGNAETMFAQLLELSNSTFANAVPRNDEEYIRQKENLENDFKDLKELSNNVFKSLIRKTVEKKIKGTDPQQAKQMASDAFSDQKEEAVGAFDQLHAISQKMVDRVNEPEEINLHKEIASFAQVMKTFATREKNYNAIETLDPADKENIQRAMTPLFDRAQSISLRLERLQELQLSYSYQARVVALLLSFEKTIQETQNLKFSREMKEKMEQDITELAHLVPDYAELPQNLRQYQQAITNSFDLAAADDKVCQKIDRLFPADGSAGLIRNLLDYRQGKREKLPSHFKLSACLQEIEKTLAIKTELFPEAIELKVRIRQMENLALPQFDQEWGAFEAYLLQIAEDHSKRKAASLKKLLDAGEAFHQYIDLLCSGTSQYAGYIALKQQKHTEMKNEMAAISKEVEKLKNDAEKVQQLPQLHLTDKLIGGAGAALTGLSGALGAAIGYATGLGVLPGAAAASSAVSTLMNRGLKAATFRQALDNGSVHAEPFVTAAAAGATAALVPTALGTVPGLSGAASTLAAGTALAGTYMGYKAGTGVLGQAIDTGQNKVLPEVERHFDNAFSFLLGSEREHIFHGLITRLMKTTIDTHPAS